MNLELSTQGFALLNMVVATLLPILVGLVTKEVTHPGAKAGLLALLAAITGFLTELLNNPNNFDIQTALIAWIGVFLVSVATHYGFLKPTGVSAKAQRTLNSDRNRTVHVRGNRDSGQVSLLHTAIGVAILVLIVVLIVSLL